VSAVGKRFRASHQKDAAALLGTNILFQILAGGGYTEQTPVTALAHLLMINRNYLFYLWVLRKLPLEFRSSPNFYFLLNSVFAVAFLLPIAGLMFFLSNPIASWSCLWAALVLSLN